jgi:hypothetical protein
MDDLFIANADAGERVGTAFAPLRYGQKTDVFGVKYSCPGPNPDVKAKKDPPLGIGVSESRARLSHVQGLGDEVKAMLDEFASDFPA